jgi:hypothetical protein
MKYTAVSRALLMTPGFHQTFLRVAWPEEVGEGVERAIHRELDDISLEKTANCLLLYRKILR